MKNVMKIITCNLLLCAAVSVQAAQQGSPAYFDSDTRSSYSSDKLVTLSSTSRLRQSGISAGDISDLQKDVEKLKQQQESLMQQLRDKDRQISDLKRDVDDLNRKVR